MQHLTTLVEELPIYLTIASLAFVFLEWGLLLYARKLDRSKEGWVNVLSAGLAFGPIFLITKLFFLIIMFGVYQFRLFDPGFALYAWAFCWILYDFLFWLIHYLGHKVRIIWCLHNVHHSAKEMKLSVAFRGSFFDFLIVPHNVLWLPLLGFHPFMVLIVDGLGKFYGILMHINEHWVSDNKRRWYEKIIITPSAHRVHHSVNPIYLDANFGETLSIWDRIFGTYQEEIDHEKPQFGILKDIDSEDLLETQSGEFVYLWKDIRAADRLTDKLKYLFMPPGWNHIDGGTRAKDIRMKSLAELKENLS